jgi:hypothetical protein
MDRKTLRNGELDFIGAPGIEVYHAVCQIN